MAVVQGAAILVGSDSAAVHMAVGFDRPLVALYGPTNVARVGPYLRARDVLQHVQPGEALDHKAPGEGSLGRAQMARIGADEVIEACAQRLG
jgi:heptosyltransferase-1